MFARRNPVSRKGAEILLHRNLSLAFALHKPPVLNSRAEDEPMIIMHGLFGSQQNNRSVSKCGCLASSILGNIKSNENRALARQLDKAIYAVDLRNHGESPHDPLHTYSSMADDIEEFIQEHNLRHPILVGHSMGAKVAMTVALRSPKLIKSLISVDNAPIDANLKSNFHRYIQGLREVEEKSIRKQAEADEILSHYEKDPAIRQFLLTNLIRSDDGNHLKLRIPVKILASSLDGMGDFPYKDPDVLRYDGPTLFLRGTRSHYVADDVLPVIGRFFPKFVVVDIDSGHWVISEKPEEFRRAVAAFMQDEDRNE